MHLRQPNWTRILTILLVLLATFALLYILFSVLSHFKQAILLFTLGAILAYVLTPLANRLENAFRVRWLAILLSYSMVAVFIFALGVLMFTPFVQQLQSLIDNLHNPSSSSLGQIVQVDKLAGRVSAELETQRHQLLATRPLAPAGVTKVDADIAQLQGMVTALRTGTVSGPHLSKPVKVAPGRIPPNPIAQTRVPPSYVAAITLHLTPLASDYAAATANPSAVNTSLFARAISDARQTETAAKSIQHTMATTPILLLRSQTWLDEHALKVDLHSKFGQAASQLSSQGTLILDNAITILSETATILLDFILVLIISFYFLSDGGNMIHRGLALVPSANREQAWFFVGSLDKVLGGYIRGQLLLSAVAGILGGGGAAVLGVPYPLLIGIATALLQMIPVIGPMLGVVPAVIISLFFMPVLTTIILAAWFIVFQQIVTNVLGPRIMGAAVGIHPLEALVAVLVGYPLGGFLGAFLAVPVAGIVHILLREAYAYFVLGHSLPTAAVPEQPAEAPAPLPHPASSGPRPGSAAG